MQKFPTDINKNTIRAWIEALIDELGIRADRDVDKQVLAVLVSAQNELYDSFGLDYTRRDLPNIDNITWVRDKRSSRDKKGVLRVIRAAEAYTRIHELDARAGDHAPTPDPVADTPGVGVDHPPSGAHSPLGTPRSDGAVLLEANVNTITERPEHALALGLRVREAREAAMLTLDEAVARVGRPEFDVGMLAAIERGEPWPASTDHDLCLALVDALEWDGVEQSMEAFDTVISTRAPLRRQLGSLIADRITELNLTEGDAARSINLDPQTLRKTIDGVNDAVMQTIGRIQDLGRLEAAESSDPTLLERVDAFAAEVSVIHGQIDREEASATRQTARRLLLAIGETGHRELYRRYETRLRDWESGARRPRRTAGEQLVGRLRGLLPTGPHWSGIIGERRSQLGLDKAAAARRAGVPAGVWEIIESGLVDPTKVLTEEQCVWALRCTRADLTREHDRRTQIDELTGVFGSEPEFSVTDATDLWPDLPPNAVLTLRGDSDADTLDLAVDDLEPDPTPEPAATSPSTPETGLMEAAYRQPKILMPYTHAIVTAFWDAVATSGHTGDEVRAEYFPDMNITSWKPLRDAAPAPPPHTLYGKTLVRLAHAVEGLTGRPITTVISDSLQLPVQRARKATKKTEQPARGASAESRPPSVDGPGIETRPYTEAQRSTVQVLATRFTEELGHVLVTGDDTTGATTTTLIPPSADLRSVRRQLAVVIPQADLAATAMEVRHEVADRIAELLPETAAEVRSMTAADLVNAALEAAGLQVQPLEGTNEVIIRVLSN